MTRVTGSLTHSQQVLSSQHVFLKQQGHLIFHQTGIRNPKKSFCRLRSFSPGPSFLRVPKTGSTVPKGHSIQPLGSWGFGGPNASTWCQTQTTLPCGAITLDPHPFETRLPSFQEWKWTIGRFPKRVAFQTLIVSFWDCWRDGICCIFAGWLVREWVTDGNTVARGLKQMKRCTVNRRSKNKGCGETATSGSGGWFHTASNKPGKTSPFSSRVNRQLGFYQGSLDFPSDYSAYR